MKVQLRRALLTLAAIVVGLPLAAILLFGLYWVGWFNAGILYSGDGTYRRGVGEVAFQVEFPPIDLNRPGRQVYRFRRLGPPMSYAVGFRVLGGNGEPLRSDEYGRPDLDAAERPDAKVLIRLQNERGETVFRHSRSLQDWDWLRNMAQIDDKVTEVPIGGGSVQIQPLGVGPDGGWGTHFEPRYFGRYTLVVSVEHANTTSRSYLVHPVIEAYTAWP